MLSEAKFGADYTNTVSRKRCSEPHNPAPSLHVLPSRKKSECTGGCSTWGTCNEELGRCDCPRHLTGPNCSQELVNISEACMAFGFNNVERCLHNKALGLCLNECNHKGTCISGFCKCDTGTIFLFIVCNFICLP